MAERRPRRERDEEVLVWPDLVFVEFIAALLFTLALVILAFVANAPLQDHANSNVTPNPSKAPWYFLNLQELLLHMEPSLAGVIVPTVFLILLAAVPYYDRSNEGQGVWFGTRNAKGIIGWSALFSFVIVILLVLYDAGIQTQIYAAIFHRSWPSNLNFLANTTNINGAISWPTWTRHIPFLPFKLTLLGSSTGVSTFQTLDFPFFLTSVVIPIVAMIVLPIVLLILLKRRYGDFNRRDAMIALFTGFIVVWTVMTFIGVSFRGEGMQLLPPWEVHNPPDVFIHISRLSHWSALGLPRLW
jgi:quinol-cytochrome oxidoreductase complex cytochrome b subunit